MSVYEARYRKIEDDPKPPTSLKAASTMSQFEIKRGLSGTWPKIPLILAGFLVFGFLVTLNSFLLAPAGEFWLGEGTGGQGEDGPPLSVLASISALLTPIDGPGAIMIIHIAVISGGLISGDLRDRAIDLYYSKIGVGEYFGAKIIASIALTFIGMPLFTIIYFIVAVYKRWPEFSEYHYIWEIFWQMSLVLIFEVVFLSVIILVFSAYTESPINSGVIFVVFVFVSRVIFEVILFPATQIDVFYVLSPFTAVDTMRQAVFNPYDGIYEVLYKYDIFGWIVEINIIDLSVISYFFYLISSLALIYYKLRKAANQ